MSSLVGELKEQLEEIKFGMEQNIEQVLQRGDKLDELEERSESLAGKAESFKIQSFSKRVSLCIVFDMLSQVAVGTNLVF